jgi:hypothetical protein
MSGLTLFQLLLAILRHCAPSIGRAAHETIARDIEKDINEPVTAKAVSERILKIRKMNNLIGQGGTASTPATPRKIAPATGASKRTPAKTPVSNAATTYEG